MINENKSLKESAPLLGCTEDEEGGAGPRGGARTSAPGPRPASGTGRSLQSNPITTCRPGVSVPSSDVLTLPSLPCIFKPIKWLKLKKN